MVAAICIIQNPAFLGFFEEQCSEIGKLAHSAGAEYVVYADPSSLGIILPPADYGADIACGEIQPLGIHMIGVLMLLTFIPALSIGILG